MHKSSEVLHWGKVGGRPSDGAAPGQFLRMLDFKRLYARIDDEDRLPWERERTIHKIRSDVRSRRRFLIGSLQDNELVMESKDFHLQGGSRSHRGCKPGASGLAP